MSQQSAFMAVKNAIGGESFGGEVNVQVWNGTQVYAYESIYVRVAYNVGYMQMDVDIDWDGDKSRPEYRTLGLHAGYNSNFQDFKYDNGCLHWEDGANTISIYFKQ